LSDLHFIAAAEKRLSGQLTETREDLLNQGADLKTLLSRIDGRLQRLEARIDSQASDCQ
jgi:hypothetical protein